MKSALAAAALAVALPLLAVETKPSAEQLEFFEKHIRPVLVENCYKCHSPEAEKLKGGLLLDTREGLLKGGDSGPALVPGNPEKSLLIKAVRYQDEDLAMPPRKGGGKKLPGAQIADLEAWVKMGAPEPRTDETTTSTLKTQRSGTNHWAFQPVKKPPVPAVKNFKSWVQSPVDAFIAAKLEEKGMKPSELADKRTLIRRATFDLLGLPPTPEEVQDFLADKSKNAFARVIERLLGSPHYGERWGRYWLDVARYADTKGYLVANEERRFPFSYTYRDYVIRAFNEDLPYDQFVIQQIAADQLPLGEDPARRGALAGLGFLTLGRRFLNNQNEIIDDRIDVVCRGTMGLTVACARCHDHKFDPIPTKDYYSLYGVFASSTEPADEPLLGRVEESAAYQDYLKEKAKREAAVDDYIQENVAKFQAKLRTQVGDYLLAAREAQKRTNKGRLEVVAGERKLTTTVLEHWLSSLAEWSKKHDPIFAPWFAFAALPDKDFPVRAKDLAAKFAANSDAARPLNPFVAQMFAGPPPASLKQAAESYNKLFTETEQHWQEMQESGAKSQAAAPAAMPDKNEEALRQVLYAKGSPNDLSQDELRKILGRTLRTKVTQLQGKVAQLSLTHPGAPARAMALVDKPNPENPRVLIRGNPGNPGPEVPRQFLEIVAGPDRQPFQHGSGRLEMAQAIASRDNPLTARVMVNRIWLHHFGAGLVRTPSDFGVRSDPPSHPELLDYLAARFMEEGWSIKKLHRLIMLSRVYQQSSNDNTRYAQSDPANQYLWKMNRRRLDFEALRDSLLACSGQLDLTPGGQPVDITAAKNSPRRTVYGFIDRQNLPGLFRTFDFASPDTSSPQRFSTTVPQQALFMMNSAFVVQQARHLVTRSEVQQAATEDKRLQAIYEILYQRAPDAEELKLARKFLHAQPENQPENATAKDSSSSAKTNRGVPLTAWEKFAQVLLLSNELMFVD